MKDQGTGSQLSEGELLRLIHELEVHQIELELQNEELINARDVTEASNNRYVSLHDFASFGYYTLSRNGEIIELSLTGALMLGKDSSHLLNKHFCSFVSGDTLEVFNLFLEKSFISKTKESCEITLTTYGNQSLYVHLSGIVDENGTRCMVTAVDITERNHARQKLLTSEEMYHAIFQGSHDGIMIADAESKMITYANAAQCHLFGYTVEQFKAMSIAAIHPQDTFAHTLAEFESMLQGKTSLAENIQCLKKNGEIFYADISGALISLNERTQLLGFFRDISARKNAENALKASEDKYRKDLIFLQSILESPITIVIFSIDKNYCYTNFSVSHKETMRKIWGVDIRIGMNILDLIANPEDREKAKNNFDRAFKGDFFILTEEYGDKELSRIYYDNYYNPVNDDGGNIVGISVFVLDVTQRKQN